MMNDQPRIAVIITAAGASRRMGGVKKEYRALDGRHDAAGKPLTVIGASFLAFAAVPGVDAIVITYPPAPAGTGGSGYGHGAPAHGEEALRAALPAIPDRASPALITVPGGETRRESVHRALEALAARDGPAPGAVLIHDGARPWVDRDLIERVTGAALRHGAAIPLSPLSETPKEHEGGFIKTHLKRDRIGAAQTPQAFIWPDILEAHRAAHRAAQSAAQQTADGENRYTDDAEVWGIYGGAAAIVPGSPRNRKITFPEDLAAPGAERDGEGGVPRVGTGRDIHPLVAGRRFLLGGVVIPFTRGEAGHSDGDALTHAVIDALLGAAAAGDIGELFPDRDARYRDADSMELLKTAWRAVRARGFTLGNLDCVVICEAPKILPWREHIRASLALALETDAARIFVKGKTNEGFGQTGQGRAVETLATALLFAKNS
ncbi:MAG: 2-C-methyl-D-erythritol 2,4-cyclodiphosphate synthase [Spirochaetaceae bacterium]|jgi:2-C-methyl-D-erythritol 4-phosphate cytidylyltransferase/2-C-methyl-D-erythritol 2,4-cyclodiphosphate synthase|nr:2-C-methyl-D-erythritol 2,4-cyclodiphosphate synthase [Spirochaetaceae bacterium]